MELSEFLRRKQQKYLEVLSLEGLKLTLNQGLEELAVLVKDKLRSNDEKNQLLRTEKLNCLTFVQNKFMG